MAAPFDIVAIDHVVLRAADPAALERFYLDVLGLTFETRQGKLAQLRAGRGLIDIVPADEPGPARGMSSPGGANLDHLCLRVGTVRRGGDCEHLAGQGVDLRSGDLAQWCRRQGSIDLPARSGRNGVELKGTGHRWGAISALEARYCGAAFESVATWTGKLVRGLSAFQGRHPR